MSSWTWEGDVSAAAFWLPFAEGKQLQLELLYQQAVMVEKQMRQTSARLAAQRAKYGVNITKHEPPLGTVPFRKMSGTYTPVDGVLIHVRIHPHHIHIKAGEFWLYLESGFYQFDTISSKTPDKPIHAYVHYSPNVIAVMEGNKYPEQVKAFIYRRSEEDEVVRGKDPEDGFKSESFLPFTYRQYVSNPTLSISSLDELTDKILQTILNPTYEKTDLARYKAMLAVTPSVFAGKLQMLVQSLYSAKEIEIKQSVLGELLHLPFLEWQNEILSPLGKGYVNTGLLTTENYDYFIVQMGGGEARIRRLRMSKEAEEIKAALLDNKIVNEDRRLRAEAYILSTLYFDIEKDGEYGQTVTFDPVDGFILWYGWHWNWDGTEGDAIKHDIIVADNHATYKTYHEKVEITYTIDRSGEYSFNISATKVSEHTWWRPALWLGILRPKYDFEQGEVLVNDMYDALYLSNELGLSIDGPEGEFTDVPVYCFRDDNDTLEFVKVSQELEYTLDVVNQTGGWFPVPEDSRVTEGYINTGYNGTVSVSCAGTTVEGDFLNRSNWNRSYAKMKTEYPSAGPGDRTPSTSYLSAPHTTFPTVQDYLLSTGYFEYKPPPNIYPVWGKDTGETYNVFYNGTWYERDVYYVLLDGYGSRYVESIGHSTPQSDHCDISIIIPYDTCHSVMIVNQQFLSERRYLLGYRYSTEDGGSVANYLSYIQVEVGRGYSHPDGNGTRLLSRVANLSGFKWQGGAVGLAPNDAEENIVEPEVYEGSMTLISKGSSTVIETKDESVYDYFTFSLLDPYVQTPDFCRNSLHSEYRLWTGYSGSKSNNYNGIVSVGWA